MSALQKLSLIFAVSVQMLESVPQSSNNKSESGEISSDLSQEIDTLLKPLPYISSIVRDDRPEIFLTSATFRKHKQSSDDMLEYVPESSYEKWESGEISSDVSQGNDTFLKPVPQINNIIQDDRPAIVPTPAIIRKHKRSSDGMLESVPESSNDKWESVEISSDLSKENDTFLKPVPQINNIVRDDQPEIFPTPAIFRKHKQSSDQMLESVPESSNEKGESGEIPSDLSQENDTFSKSSPQINNTVQDDRPEIFPTPAIFRKDKQSCDGMLESVPESSNDKEESGEISSDVNKEHDSFLKPVPQIYNTVRDYSPKIFPTPVGYGKFKEATRYVSEVLLPEIEGLKCCTCGAI